MSSAKARRERVRKFINVDIREPITPDDPRVATMVIHDPATGQELYRGRGIVSMRVRGRKEQPL